MSKYIGNIITVTPVETFSSYVYVTNDINDSNIDFNLPTLVVGWELVKSYYPDVNILDWKIKDNLYWTFSRRERRYKHEEDLDLFEKKVMKTLRDKLEYKYFNIFTSSCEDIKKVIRYIKKRQSIIYVSYDMLYLLYGTKVIGFSLKDAEYIGVKREKIFKLIAGNCLIYNTSFLSEVDRKSFHDNNIMIPYLFFLNAS